MNVDANLINTIHFDNDGNKYLLERAINMCQGCDFADQKNCTRPNEFNEIADNCAFDFIFRNVPKKD